MRTKHILLLTPLLLFAVVSVKSQNNLIQNPIIENPINVYSPLYPGMVDDRNVDVGSGDGLDHWEDQLKKKNITDEFGKTQVLLHSPEWFMYNQYWIGSGSYSKLTIYEYSPAGTVFPHSGEGFLGMGLGELVQQKFPNSNDFEEGESYTLNFYIRPVDQNNLFSNSDWSQGLDLKVYLRKSKMKYSTSANNKNNRCDETKYFNKKSMSNTETIVNEHIDLSNYPTGQWHPITVEFTAPPSSYDWIVFETQGNVDPCDGTYLLLDDFTLAKSCEFPSCDRTSGDVFPHHNGFVTYTTPLTISNLNNVSAVTVEVYPITGQTPIWAYTASCTNGIQDPIYWDGRAFSGSYVANGTYVLKTTYTNDCGTNSKSSAFIKNGDYSPIINNNIVCNTSGIETPIPCCVYEPNLVIDNVTLPGPGLLDYHVINKIDVAPVNTVTVASNGEVEMRAGYEIELHPGFSTDPGAYFLAEIVPCANSGRLRPSDVEPVMLSMEKKESIVAVPNSKDDVTTDVYDEENEGKELAVKVFPNPSATGRFDIQTLNHSVNSYVEVLNLMGTVVYTSRLGASNTMQIDISDQAKGIYLVRVVDGEQILVKKVIYQ